MAISPQAIETTFKELTDAEEDQVDELEKECDHYITNNYFDSGYVIWSVPDAGKYTLNQRRELANRYRRAGWRIQVFGDADNCAYLFEKGGKPQFDDVIRAKGTN